MSALLDFIKLDNRDKVISLITLVFLPVSGILKTSIGFGFAQKSVGLLFRLLPIPKSLRTPYELASLVYSVQDKIPFSDNCLSRSMIIFFLLRRMGYEPKLEFGQQVNEAGMDAHAWVTVDGTPLAKSDENLDSFERFDEPVLD